MRWILILKQGNVLSYHIINKQLYIYIYIWLINNWMCIRSSNDSHTLRNEDITLQDQNHVNMHDSYITVRFDEVGVICFQFLSSYITCFFYINCVGF